MVQLVIAPVVGKRSKLLGHEQKRRAIRQKQERERHDQAPQTAASLADRCRRDLRGPLRRRLGTVKPFPRAAGDRNRCAHGVPRGCTSTEYIAPADDSSRTFGPSSILPAGKSR